MNPYKSSLKLAFLLMIVYCGIFMIIILFTNTCTYVCLKSLISILGPDRAGSCQSLIRNLARGPLFLSGPTQPGPHFCRPVVARGNILLARMARI